jgi:hypothetical protein
MTTKEIGRLLFFIPVVSVMAWAIGTIIWCAWEAAKSADRLEQYYDNPNSVRHRVYFFIWMLIISCMIVGAFLADIS